MLTSKTGKLTVQRGCIQGSPSTCIGRSLLVLEPPNQRNNSESLRAGESLSLPPQREKHEARTCSLRKGSSRPGELSENIIFCPSKGLYLAGLEAGLQIWGLTVTIGISLKVPSSDSTLRNCHGRIESHSHLENWPANMVAPLLSNQPEGKVARARLCPGVGRGLHP